MKETEHTREEMRKELGAGDELSAWAFPTAVATAARDTMDGLGKLARAMVSGFVASLPDGPMKTNLERLNVEMKEFEAFHATVRLFLDAESGNPDDFDRAMKRVIDAAPDTSDAMQTSAKGLIDSVSAIEKGDGLKTGVGVGTAISPALGKAEGKFVEGNLKLGEARKDFNEGRYWSAFSKAANSTGSISAGLNDDQLKAIGDTGKAVGTYDQQLAKITDTLVASMEDGARLSDSLASRLSKTEDLYLSMVQRRVVLESELSKLPSCSARQR